VSAPDRTIPLVTLRDVFAAGEVDPCRPYEATGLTAGVDREVAEGSPCSRCGGACGYAGFRTVYGTWRAYQVCADPACQHAEEF
jgi:hypothetical protein